MKIAEIRYGMLRVPLRDCSSQQLADALQISQSSVVKLSQMLGLKGYPDLKYSIGEAVARGGDVPVKVTAKSTRTAVRESLAETLWQSKSRAEEQTRLINDAGTLNEIAMLLGRAGKVFCIGFATMALPPRHLLSGWHCSAL